MTNPTRLTGQQTLKERLSKLEIALVEGSDNKYYVFSTCEPFFCFESDSREELLQLAQETVESYVATFYEVGRITIQPISEPARTPVLPVTKVRSLCPTVILTTPHSMTKMRPARS